MRREEQKREKERERAHKKECLSGYERNCRKICRFIRIQALFVLF